MRLRAKQLRPWRSAVVIVAALALSVVGCSRADSLDEQAADGQEKSYVAGDGTVTELAPEARGEPISAAGLASDSSRVSLADFRGDVVVVNVWYAACGPCREEAPDLAALSESFSADGVQFVGVNTRDDAGTAAAFERSFSMPYPSIVDTDGSALASLSGQVSPNAVPTTLVLDRQGRVAGRVLGLAERSTLRAMVSGVLAEPS